MISTLKCAFVQELRFKSISATTSEAWWKPHFSFFSNTTSLLLYLQHFSPSLLITT
ncbi:hypothetical protein DsansV1_C06g0064151 [Dioscorea sansibarensis]